MCLHVWCVHVWLFVCACVWCEHICASVVCCVPVCTHTCRCVWLHTHVCVVYRVDMHTCVSVCGLCSTCVHTRVHVPVCCIFACALYKHVVSCGVHACTCVVCVGVPVYMCALRMERGHVTGWVPAGDGGRCVGREARGPGWAAGGRPCCASFWARPPGVLMPISSSYRNKTRSYALGLQLSNLISSSHLVNS